MSGFRLAFPVIQLSPCKHEGCLVIGFKKLLPSGLSRDFRAVLDYPSRFSVRFLVVISPQERSQTETPEGNRFLPGQGSRDVEMANQGANSVT